MVEVHKGNVSSCARALDVSETAIRKRLKKV
jgi:transcriptional regulator of acetoin/glycerol metabolism